MIKGWINDIYKSKDKIVAVFIRDHIRLEIECTPLYSELRDIVKSEDYYFDYDNYAYSLEINTINPQNLVLLSEGEYYYSTDDYYIYSDLGQLVIVEGRMLKIEKLLK